MRDDKNPEWINNEALEIINSRVRERHDCEWTIDDCQQFCDLRQRALKEHHKIRLYGKRHYNYSTHRNKKRYRHYQSTWYDFNDFYGYDYM